MIKANITKENNSLQARIMRRVYTIWFAKRVLPYLVVETSGFVAFLYVLSRMVYVRIVLENAIAALFANPRTWVFYEVGAFFNLRPVVQAMFLASMVLLLVALRNVFKAAVEFNIMKYETKPARASLYR